jgi:DNA mismatch endonuclease (patch repair protein)
MADHLSLEGRSRVMAAIRSKNTKPERALRAMLRTAGATGYRIHAKQIPGKPDVAFTRWRVAAAFLEDRDRGGKGDRCGSRMK